MQPLVRLSFTKMLGLNLLVASLYFVLGRLAFTASVDHEIVTSIIFLPEGVSLAFAILWGAVMAPGIFLGQFLLSFTTDMSLSSSLTVSFFNALGAVLGAHLFRLWNVSNQFSSLKDIFLFCLIVLAIVQPISATAGIAVLYFDGGITNHFDILSNWANWWMANSVGQLLLVPLLLSWIVIKAPISLIRSIDLLFIALSGLMLFVVIKLNWQHSPILLVLSYPILMLAAIRFGLREITLANLFIAIALVAIGVHGYGVMEHFSLEERSFYISVIIAAGVISSLVLHALLAERNSLIKKLQATVNIDDLTSISNRRHFVKEANKMIELLREEGKAVSIALLDLDHFKKINDKHGHATGDLVLQMLSSKASEFLGANYLLGRLGGEEFAILMPDTSSYEARFIIDKLREFIKEQEVITVDGSQIHVTFSAGIAEMIEGHSLEVILDRSDMAMYKAKEDGRDRVVVCTKERGFKVD